MQSSVPTCEDAGGIPLCDLYKDVFTVRLLSTQCGGWLEPLRFGTVVLFLEPCTMTQLWVGGSPGKVPWGVLYTEVSLWWYLPGHLVWYHLCVCVCGCVGVCLCAHLIYNNICMHTIYMYALCALVVPCMCVVCRSSAAPVPPPLQLWCSGGGGVPQLEGRHHSGLPGQGEGTLPGQGRKGEQASYPPSPYFHSHFCL